MCFEFLLRRADLQNEVTRLHRKFINCRRRFSKGCAPLWNLCVLCVSVVVVSYIPITTETQRTQRFHREEMF
jgi:hypothetical protein